MAYATSNPPKCVVSGFNDQIANVWHYESTDAAAVVDTAAYISNAQDLGMKVGDVVFVRDTDASPSVTTLHTVASIDANGAADLLDAGATIGTDTD